MSTTLVTGSMGCIGAWTLYHLVQQGRQIVSFDISDDRSRLDLLLTREEQAAITFVPGDLSDGEALRETLAAHEVTAIIHLGALQVPACRANPALGAHVNVVGTVNIFEAARQHGLDSVVYASSIAVYGPAAEYAPGPVAVDAPLRPRTLYGVWKVTNESTARLYWDEHRISSTALRPYTVYGVGRDQGLTSEPTQAMRLAAAGQDAHISFGGRMQFHYASDVALQFIEAADNPRPGAQVFNMGTQPVAVADVAALIEQYTPGVRVTVGDVRLPFPEHCDGSALYASGRRVYETPLEDGVQQTIEHFARLLRG